nr:CHAT domain-containing protein [Actinomycetota bacterium]
TVLDRSIEAARTGVDAAPENHPLLPTWLASLTSARYDRAFLRHQPDPVNEAIETYRRLLRLTPEDDPQHATRLLALADLLHLRCKLTTDASALNEAIDVTRTALRSDTLDQRSRATANLSAMLIDLATVTGRDESSLEAMAVLRDVLRDSTLEPATQAAAWHNLSVALLLRHDSTGTGLDEAVVAARQAVARSEVENGERAERLGHLAGLLAQTHDGLDEAERIGRQAVRECPPDHPGRPAVLFGFAETLRQRYLRFGSPGELDEAITLLRQAVAATTEPVNHGVRLATLAAALRARYARWPDLTSLNDAIAASREATAVLPAAHHQRTRLLANRVTLLLEHYRRTGHLDSLTEAVEIGERAIAATPEDHPALGIRLANYGMALSARFDHTGEPADLEAALQADRRAVDLTSAEHSDRGRRLANLSAVLLKHYELTENRDDIESAVNAAREAVNDTPDGHPSRPIRLINLAVSLGQHGVWTGDLELLLEAVRAAEAAAAVNTATPFTRLRAARVWGRFAAMVAEITTAIPGIAGWALRVSARIAGMTVHWETAAEGFQQGVRLLPLVAPRNLRRDDLEHQLVDVDRIAADAAASALWAGNAAGALEVLEQGRGVLLSYALDSRSELTDLHAAAPELAAEWETLGEELDTATAFPDEMLAEEAVPVSDSDHRHGLARRWQSLLNRIRATPGFERFLEPPRLEELLPAAASGAVVTVNVSDLRCDALVLTADAVRVVRLSDLRAEELDERVSAFLDALDVVGIGDLAERMAAQAALRQTLAWLWDVLAEPVLNELGHTAPPAAGSPWPRVWWSPTGPLNFLPLHAAGRYPVEYGYTVLDRVVSSYTPTIRALLHARSRPAAPQRRLLSVAMPQTPGQEPLPATLAEAEALAEQLGGERTLVDAAATHGNVRSALASASWAHFACHAYSDPVSPSKSHLLLHDRPMSIAEVSRLRLEHAELAYLSACSTARGSTRLADEAIHIASAFQLAGYRHVVGTLWPVHDTTAAGIAEGFYGRLTDGTSPSDALHAVIRGLREEQPLTPSQWAAYVHAGP